MEDTLLKKPDVIKILKIGRNKLYDIINSGQFISPIRLPNTQIDLYSNNELQEWIRQQKDVRDKNINNQ
ncbi:AlpA family phage regulatory protein [Aliarcobacter cryaerophilus]|uniref:helix-turn-helix transcriptional regulator n=1 Tax=Aliarcobacter cryaerophilus TaxID=28198 RepID=UPI0021B5F5F8|nr:AlpA family phage regulatory protein [Aliarcobacter cryaerophilus]MCT7533167.1 AlpA family phage regulatory protein [Aliarcobacter cryaerophilus]